MLYHPNRTIVLHCNGVYNRRLHQTIGCENDIFSHPSGPIKRLGLLVFEKNLEKKLTEVCH